MEKIGLGITTHNRKEIFSRCHLSWALRSPEDLKIVVVDDGSTDPVHGADFRFETPQGVSVAKNKCLELLDDCDHIFIVDDDIFPLDCSWYKPYIESGLYHACFTFGRKIKNVCPVYIEYEKPCGLMLYFRRKCIEEVGGWDTEFNGYGYEHVNLSDRIFNAGFTPARYIDVNHKLPLFHSFDKEHQIASTIGCEVRAQTIPVNYKLYLEKYNSKEFKPYK